MYQFFSHLGSVGLLLAAALVLVMVIARALFGISARFVDGYSLTEKTVHENNSAVGIRYAMFSLAVVVSIFGILQPSDINLGADLEIIAKHGLLAIFLVWISGKANDRLILWSFSNNEEVAGKMNVSVAIVEGGSYLATAFIMQGALAGWEGGFWISIGWFVIGQIFLIGIANLYALCVPALQNTIQFGNTAAGLSYGGFILAAGLVMGTAVSGPFTGWLKDIAGVATYLPGWALTMLVAHWAADAFMLPGARFRDEVISEGNIAAGIIECVTFIGATLIYIKVW